MIYKWSRHDVLATSIVDDEVAYIVLDRTSWIKDLMSLCGVENFWLQSKLWTTQSTGSSCSSAKSKSLASSITTPSSSSPPQCWFGSSYSIHWTYIQTLHTYDTCRSSIGVRIFFTLCGCGGYCCWCRHRGFDCLLCWLLVNHRKTQLNFFATQWHFNWHVTPERQSTTFSAINLRGLLVGFINEEHFVKDHVFLDGVLQTDDVFGLLLLICHGEITSWWEAI